jgi:hypothetical protein
VETKIKNKPGPKPLPAANPAWTAELAYVCGLMASDGCLISNGKTINLTSKDIDQLETFKKILGLKTPLSWKWRGAHDIKYPQVQFCNVRLYRWFQSIGISPHKSLTIHKVLVPDNFFFDFLRGEFDGDGCSYAYWDTRWRSSVSIYVSFVSGSKKYLEWIQEKTNQLAGVCGVVAPGTRGYSLKYAKYQAKILHTKMYYEKAMPHLKRKKEKFDRQLQSHDWSLSKQCLPVNILRHSGVQWIT